MQVRLEIAGIDQTSRLLTEHPVGNTWSLSLNEGAEIDTATFSLDDPDNTLSVVEGQDVTITRTDVTPEVRLFGGIITQVQVVRSGVGRVFNVQAQDWTLLLHRATVDKDYVSQTDAAIIADAFTQAGLTEINTSTRVQTIKTFDKLRFTGHTLYQVVDILAESAGAIWYVDPLKRLVYQTPTTSEAAFSLSDQPNDSISFGYWGLQHLKDATSAYNRVVVRGGRELSDNQELVLAGNGTQTIFVAEKSDGHQVTEPPSDANTAYTPQGVARVEVYKNTGSDASPVWTQQGVGREGEDTLGAAFDGKTVDVLWNAITGRLIFNTAPPNLTKAIKVRGRYWIQIEVEERNQALIDAMSGRLLTRVIVDPSIVTTDMAIDVAVAFLNEHGVKERATVSFDRDGLEIGQQVRLVNAKLGINKLFTCHALNITFQGGVTAFYTATLGSGSHSLEHILTEIHEATRREPGLEEARTDVRRPASETVEVVDEWLSVREMGPDYYAYSTDSQAIFDLTANGNLTDTVSVQERFGLSDDEDAGWPYALLLGRDDTLRRGPKTAARCNMAKAA